MKKSFLIILCLALLSCVTGCKDSTQTLLKKSVEMEGISTDSMLFYLQQIQSPNHLSDKQRAEYCFQLYKATLWKAQRFTIKSLYPTFPTCWRYCPMVTSPTGTGQ